MPFLKASRMNISCVKFNNGSTDVQFKNNFCYKKRYMYEEVHRIESATE